jgi:dipeptidyl-peptidase-4
MLGRPTTIRVTPDGKAVLFLRSGPRDRTQNLYEFDVSTGKTRELLTAARLLAGSAEQISAEEKARRERQRITTRGITAYELSEDGKLLLVPLSGRHYVVERDTGFIQPLPEMPDPLDARFSPNGRWVALVSQCDLYRVEWRSGKTERLTVDGSADRPNGLAEFVAQEEMDRHRGYWWSPDSRRIVCQHSDLRGVETLHIPDPANPGRAPQSWRYPRAGRANAKVGLRIITPGESSSVEVRWDAARFPYLAAVQWPEKAPLTLVVQSRDQQDERVLKVNPSTGATTELLREHDDAWINLYTGMPWWLESGGGFLWITEREGDASLWLHDATGRVVRPLHDATVRPRSVLHVDEPGNVVWISDATNPTSFAARALPLDPTRPPKTAVSKPDRSSQTSLIVSKNHETMVVGASGPTALPTHIVVASTGTPLGALPSAAYEPQVMPHVEFTRVGPHGEFDAAIVRPHGFVPGWKYPVLVNVYGGPGEGMVRREARPYFLPQWYANQGFIVVSADNRGVANRGRAWERAIYGNFAGVTLDDQVAALHALGARYGELDLSRVGIMGWSFGGYMAALAVMRRGDVFHAAAAGAPVVDWEDYDTHYTERYLNTPQANPIAYRRSSLLTYVADLRCPLLLIHGTADDNVYFGNSLRLTDALLRAGKTFEFAPLAGYTHLVPDPAMRMLVESRIAAFFRRNLLRTD